jgi:hypothetical protein
MGSISDPATNTITAQFVDSISDPTYGSITKSVAQQLISEALVNLNEDGITGTPSVTEWANSGTGGSAYDLDTIVGTGANLKPHPSGSCLLYGASGDYVGTPDSASFTPTTTLKIQIYIAPDNQSPGASKIIMSHWNTTGNQRSWQLFQTSAAKRLTLGTSSDGTAVTNATLDADIPFSDGEGYWAQVEWALGSGDVDFATATGNPNADPSTLTFTPLGTTQTGATGAHNSTTTLEIGSNGAGASGNFAGHLGRGVLTIDGSIVVDFNPLDAGNTGATSFASASTGETWTLNGNSFIQNTGHTVVHSIGSVGLRPTSGQTIAIPHTVFMVARNTATPAGSVIIYLDARTSSTDRTIIQTRPDDKFALFQSSLIATPQDWDNTPQLITAQLNGDSTSSLSTTGYGNVTGDVGNRSLEYASLFLSKDGLNSLQGYIARLLVFNRALTESEISSIQAYLESEYAL